MRSILIILAAVAVFAVPARAQNSRAELGPPIIVALDGIGLFPTCDTSVICKTAAITLLSGLRGVDDGPATFVELATSRTEPYLGPALARQWNLRPACDFSKSFLTPRECDIVTVPWDGGLDDETELKNYISNAKGLLRNLIEKQMGRPIVVIGHSWGSVVAFQALYELESETVGTMRRVGPDAISVLVTLGSPLNVRARPYAGRIVLNALRLLPGTIPGQGLVLGKNAIHKSDIVERWINFWIEDDIISSTIASADKNHELPSFILDPGLSHFAYFDNSDKADVIGNYMYVNLHGIVFRDSEPVTCSNLVTSESEISNGYGAAYDVFSHSRTLLLRATCNSSGATVTVGTGVPNQYIYRYGYEWKDGLPKRFAFTGSNLVGDMWYVGQARATLPRTPEELEQANFFAAYVCSWTGTSWKCGCKDRICTGAYWQLQAFRRE